MGRRCDSGWVVVTVHSDGFVRVAMAADVSSAVRAWRRRYPPFIIVSAFEAPHHVFLRVMGFSGLPVTLPLVEAAALFRFSSIDSAVQSVAFRQLSVVGDLAGVLLGEWRQAVDSAALEVVA